MIPLQGSGSGLFQFLPVLLILVLFWFLIIRPQQREQKQRLAMQQALAKGDRVVTSGGIHGVVSGVEEQLVTLDIANLKGERVRIKVERVRIERRTEAAGQGAS